MYMKVSMMLKNFIFSLCLIIALTPSSSFAGRAGLLLIAEDNQKHPCLLLSQEDRSGYGRVWHDTGGGLPETVDNNSSQATAYRELIEETGGPSSPFTQSVTLQDVLNAPYSVSIGHKDPYTMFIVQKSLQPDLQNLNNLAAKKKCEKKTAFKLVKIEDVVDYLKSNGCSNPGAQAKFLGQNESFYKYFEQCLRKALPYLETLVPLSDILLAHYLPAPNNSTIFSNYVNNIIPGKSGPDNYHITLGQIKGVRSNDAVPLKQKLDRVINQWGVQFTADSCDRYLVGSSRSYASCPLVLYPTTEETRNFKALNRKLYKALTKYNRKHHTRYKMDRDYWTMDYEPHITLSIALQNDRVN
jgi:hypothetical protein